MKIENASTKHEGSEEFRVEMGISGLEPVRGNHVEARFTPMVLVLVWERGFLNGVSTKWKLKDHHPGSFGGGGCRIYGFQLLKSGADGKNTYYLDLIKGGGENIRLSDYALSIGVDKVIAGIELPK